MSFDTLLVANRGEIACRILRSAQHLGLKTVAVFSDPDRAAPHVRLADVAVRLGPAPARESYLVAERVIAAALAHGAGAVHPGYGFLSEDASFARAVEDAGLVFVGPTPEQLAAFGAKHTARALARRAGVPMIAGTELLASREAALAAAEQVGYPVMLKATGGGGGIGMQACRSAAELADAYDRVERMAAASFASSGVFLERYIERARHVEVQVFGDGVGGVAVLGDRDCSLQRRNQKVVEEAPAPGLPSRVRKQLRESARDLAASVSYRSAGTVEFVYDAEREVASFLEVNARLQVEHPVTEEVFGVDLVAEMLTLAQGDRSSVRRLLEEPPPARGFAVEARVCAEDPTEDHRPSAGLVTAVSFPAGVRVDGWVEAGTEVTTAYDPMLAKVIATGASREEAYASLLSALQETRVHGIETNLGLLRAAVAAPDVLAARHSTATLADVTDDEPRIVVERPGTHTAVQDWPGRTGLWEIGVPPSGPMDDRSFRLGNLLLGNAEGAAGLECTVDGPALRFTAAATVCLTGAPAHVTVDGQAVAMGKPVHVPAGGVLDVGRTEGPGLRTYVLVAGGLDIPAYLGSASTFTLGQFGGHGGRALRRGDVLRPTPPSRGDQGICGSSPQVDKSRDLLDHREEEGDGRALRSAGRTPGWGADGRWEVEVVEGPHAAPEFFRPDDMETLYGTDFEVHFNSARTGVRLVGPKPQWTRADGGEAGLHPSNIHDTPYSVGAVDFTGDTPILLGPDGPSLGGFVCPATVVKDERWKLGQLRPGDRVRFVPRTRDGGVLGRREEGETSPAVTYRRSGDDNLLVEYGPMALDLGLRMRVHALQQRFLAAGVRGVTDLTPGIRSLQVKLDPEVNRVEEILEAAQAIEDELPATSDLVVPSRTVHLPLSWDDPSTREAIARYMNGVRADAPWCPWNIEFIRRINGLSTVDEVYRTVFDASYLVLGLGDVYLGAPVATPLDPRHRLVTTKYNPARTWTPENAVGIGGAYLCIYGMEGPGGYQFVGRTVQVWNRWNRFRQSENPWLLRHFDRIAWYPAAADELLDMRADMAAGRFDVLADDGTFALAEHEEFLRRNASSIAGFRKTQAAAFSTERDAWAAAGEFDPKPEPEAPLATDEIPVPPGGMLVDAPFVSNVWRVDVRPGDRVAVGEPLLALEAMKLETVVRAPQAGVVGEILVTPGTQVTPGSALVVLAPEEAA